MYPLTASMRDDSVRRGVDFDEVAITCHSSLGTPYLRWVKVGVPKINQELIDSTFFLYENAAGRNAQGTGFVVSHTVDVSGGDGSRQTFTHHYAVTNAHVAHSAPVVRLNRGDAHDVFEFSECDWEYHPRDDVAVIPLDVQRRDEDTLPSIDTRYFLDDYDLARTRIGVGDDVFMIGLFIDHAGGVTNNPMARFGNISMMASNRSLVARGDGTRVASYIVDMHSRTGFSGSPVFVYRTFGSDLSAQFGRGEDVTAVVQIPTPQQLEAAMRTPRSRRPTTETLQLQLRTQPILRLLGIHWGQFPELWEVDRVKEEGARRRKKPVGVAVPEALPRRQYIRGLSGMTLVAPASKIMEVLNMPKLVAKRAAKEKPTRERRHSGPILESAPSKSADDGVPPHDHKKAFNELLDSAIGTRKRPAKR